MKCPCKDCEYRHLGCHAGCEHYHAWRADKKQRMDHLQKNTNAEMFLADQIRRTKKIKHLK